MLPAYHVLNAGKFEPNVQDSPRPNFFSYLTEVETSLIMAAFFFFFSFVSEQMRALGYTRKHHIYIFY